MLNVCDCEESVTLTRNMEIQPYNFQIVGLQSADSENTNVTNGTTSCLRCVCTVNLFMPELCPRGVCVECVSSVCPAARRSHTPTVLSLIMFWKQRFLRFHHAC